MALEDRINSSYIVGMSQEHVPKGIQRPSYTISSCGGGVSYSPQHTQTKRYDFSENQDFSEEGIVYQRGYD